jgi:hypothetical protein
VTRCPYCGRQHNPRTGAYFEGSVVYRTGTGEPVPPNLPCPRCVDRLGLQPTMIEGYVTHEPLDLFTEG